MNNERRVAVIGGGPAGMLAAATAASEGKKVILFEKNDFLGKKLLITGKGRCNVTNNADISEFIKNVPVNGNFLYSAFYSFTNTDLIDLLARLGVETKVERGDRVFPVSDKAKDVVNAFANYVLDCGAKIVKVAVKKIIVNEDNTKTVVLADKRAVKCDSVIIATGGASYPLTGSTGDGYNFAKDLGHTIVDLKPSLVPLVAKEDYIGKLQGLSLKNISVTLMSDGKKVYEDFGEMLFTHYGLSGPVVLSASSHMRKNAKYTLSVDLKPALDESMLDKRILRDFEQLKNKDFINSLDALLPKKLIPVVVELSGIDAHKKINEITKPERKNLVSLLKNLRFEIAGFRPIKEAIITSGGVNVKEINPGTMESKIVPGIFFAGEIIDTDAYTGGFNLQIAFSTGYLAGKNA